MSQKVANAAALRAFPERFRRFAVTDPCLPPPFAKAVASMQRAVVLFDLLDDELMAPAQRAFRAITGPP